LDVEASSSNDFESIVKLASLVQSLDLDHWASLAFDDNKFT
jgi:hypothetical protein